MYVQNNLRIFKFKNSMIVKNSDKMFNEFISWLSSNNFAVTAIATLVTAFATATLAIVTYFYLITSQKTLKEQEKNRKISYIQQQLEKFYIPLRIHIDDYKDEIDVSRVIRETLRANFMIYLGLCQNQAIVDQLNEFFDKTSPRGPGRLKHIEKKVTEEIQGLHRELYKLIKD